ncbi:recombinase family protein [Thiohalorhabdus denitrificans]|uniref:Site-specific DNA recombinase n=1 Tax=Thiohalorhabdus denitrificans TaxID=381306 RepID=A0A1G5ELE2_9GAMM|nr:recombinase family protein [Thiohalorhabdus denitrificans]SCY27754.1 Site-specific DNA recombinase [Thiohalorhabdus denitrificans]
MPKAYSYVRFSHPDQARGDSQRRQVEAARQWAERNGYEFDESNTLADHGVSAYHGDNLTEGSLGAFIQAVQDGHIPPGSVLVVESLDRISREQIHATLSRFMDLLARGIEIVTLTDNKHYTTQSLNDLADLMTSLVVMARAYEESATKAQRLAASWEEKRRKAREGEEKATAQCPAWLRLSEDRKAFEVIEDRAEVVRRIFQLSSDGEGNKRIAKILNEEGVPAFRSKNGWQPSYIQKILQSEAVFGRYQPCTSPGGRGKPQPDGDPIDGYYPAVVDEATFYAAKVARERRKVARAGGRPNKEVTNILRGLVACGRCGESMHYLWKGDSEIDRAIYQCGGYLRGSGCDHSYTYPYDPVIQEVSFSEQASRAMFEDERRAEAERSEAEADRLSEEITRKSRALDRLLEMFGDEEPTREIQDRVKVLSTELDDLRNQHQRAKEHAKGLRANDLIEEVEEGREPKSGPAQAGPDNRMAQRVREVVRKVVFLEGTISIHFHHGIPSELGEIRKPLGPHNKILTQAEEEELAQLRREQFLPLNELQDEARRRFNKELSTSAMHRAMKRHGLGNLYRLRRGEGIG